MDTGNHYLNQEATLMMAKHDFFFTCDIFCSILFLSMNDMLIGVRSLCTTL